MSNPTISDSGLAVWIQALRATAERAGAQFRCLEPDWDPDADPVAEVKQNGTESLIRIDGPLCDVFGVDVRGVIAALDEQSPERIVMSINSPGGTHFDGLALYSDLRQRASHGTEIVTRVDGLCASAAVMLLLAGDTREVHAGSTLMVHQAHMLAFIMGNADEMESEMRSITKALRSADKAIVSVYEERTGQAPDAVRAQIEEETWLVGMEAVDAGYATGLTNATDEDEGDEDVARAQLVARALTAHAITGALGKVTHGGNSL